MHEPTRENPVDLIVTVINGQFSIVGIPLELFEVMRDALHDGHCGGFGMWDGVLADLADALYEIPASHATEQDCGYSIELDATGYTGQWMREYGHTPAALKVVR